MKASVISCTFLFCLLTISPLFGQKEGKDEINIFSRFKLQVYEDEKPTRFFIVGHLFVFQDSSQTDARWYDVWISPVDTEKKLLLKPEYSSTESGELRNLIVKDDHFSFECVLEPERIMRVSGSKQQVGSDYEIKAVGLWWIGLLHKMVKTEWRPTTKSIVLPYTELF